MIGADALRQAVRLFSRDFSASVMAVIALALGIGFTATTFAIVDAGLIRPLPFDRTRSLVHVSLVHAGSQSGDPFPADELQRCRSVQHTLADIGGYRVGSANLSDPSSAAERHAAVWVTPAVLRIVGVVPLVGRWFQESDARPDAAAVVVISHTLWIQRYGGDEAVLGNVIRVNGEPHQVVGIMPPRFSFPLNQQLWIALKEGATPGQALDVVGRLRANVGIEQARAELSMIVAQSRQFAVPGSPAVRAEVRPFIDRYVSRDVKALLGVLLLAVCGLFLIACVDVVNLLLARTLERSHDLAIRRALGGSQWDVLKTTVGEAAIIAVPGVAGGMLLTTVGVQVTGAWIAAAGAPLWLEIRTDLPVLLWACVCGVIALGCGVLAAMRSDRRGLVSVLADQSRSITSARVGRLGRSLVFVQAALTVALLTAAGLVVKTIGHVYRSDYGFETDGILVARVDLPESRYATQDQIHAFDDAAVAGFAAIPGVRSVALAIHPPGYRGNWADVDVDGSVTPEVQETRWNAVSPGYFSTFAIPIVAGRGFETNDRSDMRLVAIVSEAFVQRRFGATQAVGRRIRLNDAEGTAGPWLAVVGVARDVRPMPGVGQPHDVYLPLAQTLSRTCFVAIQAHSTPVELTRHVRASLHAVDQDLALYDVDTMRGYLRRAASLQNVLGPLFAIFGGGALSLCIIGVHGVVALAVGRRTREMGIRVVLGATPTRAVLYVVGQVFRSVLWGAGAGVLLGVQLASAIRVVLFGIEPLNVAVLATAVLAVLGSAAAAAVAPAVRAVRISPSEALRTG